MTAPENKRNVKKKKNTDDTVYLQVTYAAKQDTPLHTIRHWHLFLCAASDHYLSKASSTINKTGNNEGSLCDQNTRTHSVSLISHTKKMTNEKMLTIFASDFLPCSLELLKNTLKVVISCVHQIRIHCMLQKNSVSSVNFSITTHSKIQTSLQRVRLVASQVKTFDCNTSNHTAFNSRRGTLQDSILLE